MYRYNTQLTELRARMELMFPLRMNWSSIQNIKQGPTENAADFLMRYSLREPQRPCLPTREKGYSGAG
ncbi:hypothetical protein SKAU_G00417260 [Synaphobranchus kaupii]|uniref:Uncharacterized protein n=1 Tax=Synaphobranchus kaupii TaxID=118154 RepID=A0A9Q1E669_SYNKA|nr:hypothetical protein SKAU_G00417260 [Synaphobranchus kaupii]